MDAGAGRGSGLGFRDRLVLRILCLRVGQEGGYEEQAGGNAHAGIRYVEGGPVVAPWKLKLGQPREGQGKIRHVELGNPREGKIEEIHHIAVDKVLKETKLFRPGQEKALREAVSHIAQHPGGDESPCPLEELIEKEAAAVQDPEQDEGDNLHAKEKERSPLRAIAHAEGNSVVVEAHKVKVHDAAATDDGDAVKDITGMQVIRGNEIEDDDPFRHLVKEVEADDGQDEAACGAVFAWHGRGRGAGVGYTCPE